MIAGHRNKLKAGASQEGRRRDRTESKAGNKIGLVIASGLLLVGLGVGADQGARVLTDSLKVMASSPSERLVDQPIAITERPPMVSEPYRPERLKDFQPPEPVPERREAGPTTEVAAPSSDTASDRDPTGTPTERPSPPETIAACSGGGVLARDICADNRLISMHRQIQGAINGQSDPRYVEYLRQRERWCAPQPSRANRQECLRDVASKLLNTL